MLPFGWSGEVINLGNLARCFWSSVTYGLLGVS